MNPSDFRAHAHALVDWMADYLEQVGTMPIVPDVQPGDILRRIPAGPPEQGEPFAALFDDFKRIIVPGMAHWQHPGWFAYFPANYSPPSLLAEMLTASLGAQCMSWVTSPAATELEQVMMTWLRDMCGLPGCFTGVIQDTASTATLVAILTARQRAIDAGADPGRLVLYTSPEAHSSVPKGARLAGFPADRVRLIATDQAFALDPAALAAAMEADTAAGLVPACVVATVGTTSSTAIDPLAPIAAICRRHGAWLHVDAAYAGCAAILPECRHHFAGVEEADSFVFNPHKWLFVHFDCSAYFVRDVDALQRTFSASPEYLKAAHDRVVPNYRDWGIQLGRRFRALKLWFVIRSYGVEGLRAMLRDHIALARAFASWVDAEPGFERVAPVPFGLVCFRRRVEGRTADDINRRLLAEVNATRRVHLTGTVLGGQYTLRLSVGQRNTRREDVELAWTLIRAAAARVD